MKKPANDSERLQTILDAVEESILSASDEEIMEDIRLEGRDPEEVASSVRTLLDNQINVQKKRKLAASKAGYLRSMKEQARRLLIPDSPDGRRSLLKQILADNAVPQKLTVAFREGEGMSDDDVLSTLEDLAELGYLENQSDDT